MKTEQTLFAVRVVLPSIGKKHLLPLKLSRYFRPSNNARLEANAMKLRSLVIRLFVMWMPVLPPTPLLARSQREAPSTGVPVHAVMTAGAHHGTDVSVINRKLVMAGRNSGG